MGDTVINITRPDFECYAVFDKNGDVKEVFLYEVDAANIVSELNNPSDPGHKAPYYYSFGYFRVTPTQTNRR